MRRKTKAVVFDLYGTLIRIRNDKKAFQRLFRELACERIHGTKNARKIAFTRDATTLSELAHIINPNHAVDVKKYEIEICEELKRAECFPETIKVLERLKEEEFPTGLISNLCIPYQIPFFSLGLSDLIDHHIFSYEIGLEKPDPEIYLKMLEKLGLDAKQVWMIGDSHHCDVKGPQSVGMNAILLDRALTTAGSVSSLEGIFQFLD